MVYLVQAAYHRDLFPGSLALNRRTGTFRASCRNRSAFLRTTDVAIYPDCAKSSRRGIPFFRQPHLRFRSAGLGLDILRRLMSDQTSKKTPPKRTDLPPLGEVAFVKTSEFRCMAYRDKEGKWRDYIRGDELPEPVTIINTIQAP